MQIADIGNSKNTGKEYNSKKKHRNKNRLQSHLKKRNSITQSKWISLQFGLFFERVHIVSLFAWVCYLLGIRDNSVSVIIGAIQQAPVLVLLQQTRNNGLGCDPVTMVINQCCPQRVQSRDVDGSVGLDQRKHLSKS